MSTSDPVISSAVPASVSATMTKAPDVTSSCGFVSVNGQWYLISATNTDDKGHESFTRHTQPEWERIAERVTHIFMMSEVKQQVEEEAKSPSIPMTLVHPDIEEVRISNHPGSESTYTDKQGNVESIPADVMRHLRGHNVFGFDFVAALQSSRTTLDIRNPILEGVNPMEFAKQKRNAQEWSRKADLFISEITASKAASLEKGHTDKDLFTTPRNFEMLIGFFLRNFCSTSNRNIGATKTITNNTTDREMVEILQGPENIIGRTDDHPEILVPVQLCDYHTHRGSQTYLLHLDLEKETFYIYSPSGAPHRLHEKRLQKIIDNIEKLWLPRDDTSQRKCKLLHKTSGFIPKKHQRENRSDSARYCLHYLQEVLSKPYETTEKEIQAFAEKEIPASKLLESMEKIARDLQKRVHSFLTSVETGFNGAIRATPLAENTYVAPDPAATMEAPARARSLSSASSSSFHSLASSDSSDV